MCLIVTLSGQSNVGEYKNTSTKIQIKDVDQLCLSHTRSQKTFLQIQTFYSSNWWSSASVWIRWIRITYRFYVVCANLICENVFWDLLWIKFNDQCFILISVHVFLPPPPLFCPADDHKYSG